jgi:hypothetical protein
MTDVVFAIIVLSVLGRDTIADKNSSASVARATDMLAGKGNDCHPNINWRRGRSSDRRQSRLHRVTITRLTTTDHDKDRHEYNVGDLDRERATTFARATAGTEVHAEPDAPTTRRGGRGAKAR